MNSYEKIAYSHGQHGSSGVTLRKAPQARPNELQPLVTLHAYLSEKLISQKILATLNQKILYLPEGHPHTVKCKDGRCARLCSPVQIFRLFNTETDTPPD
jgi:hypothetical protein